MKKKITKFLSLFLAIVLVSGTFSGFQLISEAESSRTLFLDDFSNSDTMTQNGWNANNVGTKADGVYTLKASQALYTSNAENASTWTDYVVSSKVKFKADTMPSETDTTTYYAALVARCSALYNTGYEFNMRIFKGTTYFQLWKRPNTNGVINGEVMKKTTSLEVNREYTLKMIVSGATILCYCDDQLIFSVTDAYADGHTYTQGYAGIRSSSMETVWDDYTVRELNDAEKKEILAMTTGYEYIYVDDFNDSNSMTQNGWNANNVGTKADGVYTLNASQALYTSNAENASTWTDYVVSSKVKFKADTAPSATDTNTYYAALVARCSALYNTGYEFNMRIVKGTTYFQLWKRPNTNGTVNGEVMKKTASLEVNKEYTLKMIVSGAMIVCYCDNQLIFSVTDAYADGHAYTQGYAGIRSSSMQTAWDDFTVRELTDAEEREILAMTTGYEYIYVDDFNDSSTMTQNGWSANNAGTKAEGVFTMTAGQSAYTSSAENASTWADYVVSTKVKFNADAMPDETNTNIHYAALVARCTTNFKSGYEFQMRISKGKTYFEFVKRLSDGKGGLANGEQLTKNVAFEINKEYTLKMIVSGATILCYCDDQLILNVTDAYADNLNYAQGYVGIRSSNISTVWDDFIVRELTDEEAREVRVLISGYEYIYEDYFNDSNTMTSNGWSDNNAGTKADGVYTLTAGQSAYTSNVENADTWTDYVVSTKVKFAGTMPESTDAKIYYAALVARCGQNFRSGYEFQMRISKGRTYFELVKRLPNLSGGFVNSVQLTNTVSFEVNKEYTLKMIVSGATVLCYFDDELIFNVTDIYADDLNYTKGYAGIRSSQMSTVWDDFTVRELTDEEAREILIMTSEYEYLFMDNFNNSDTMMQSGWNANNAGVKENGVFELTAGQSAYTSRAENASTWEDYVVTAKVKVAVDALPSADDKNVYYAALVARCTENFKTGYEFQMRIFKGSTYFQLLKRHASGTVDINGELLTKTTRVGLNQEYTLKMVVSGTTIFCYCDDRLIFCVTDTNADGYNYAKGYAGIRSTNMLTVWDDFIVRKITEGEVEKLAALKAGFEESIKKDSGDVWFYDNFNEESALTERGWNSDAIDIYNGALLFDKASAIYVTDVDGAQNWKDYSVSANVVVDKSNGFIGDTTVGAAWVCARSNGEDVNTTGYEFGIMTPASGVAYLRLMNRTTKEDLLVDRTHAITEGVHNLQITCEGSQIRCYFDGELVFAVTDTNNTSGYAGARASGLVTSFDEFKVTSVDAGAAGTGAGTESPKTGDSIYIGVRVWISLMILSICTIVTYVYKEHYTKKGRR